MLKIEVFAAVLTIFVACSSAQNLSLYFPRANDIMSYWPMTNYYKLRDLGPMGYVPTTTVGEPYSGAGPFGDSYSSYHSSLVGTFELLDNRFSLANVNEMTILTFFKYTDVSRYPFISFHDSSESFKDSLGVDVCDINTLCLTKNGVALTSFENIVDRRDWNFLAISVYKNAVIGNNTQTCAASITGRFGIIYPPRAVPATVCAAMTASTYGFNYGYGVRYSSSSLMYTSALMIYKTGLTESEVMSVYEGHRQILQATECGMPRIPVALPQNPPQTAKAGQFPWVARIKHTTAPHLCSGVILNRYWVLTALSCFQQSSLPGGYSVVIGDYDYAIPDQHEKVHPIRNIFSPLEPYTTTYDIALVELQSPIDYGNVYVYEACIPSDAAGLVASDTLFAVGWGENGRAPLSSNTAERYVEGDVLPTATCSENWTQVAEDPTKFVCFSPQLPDTKAPCNGDAGSPLVKLDDGNKRMLWYGIYSIRGSCDAVNNKPPLFTSIAPFWSWIKSVINCSLPGVNYGCSA